MWDIWRNRNPYTKRYTSRQQHPTGYTKRILDYFYKRWAMFYKSLFFKNIPNVLQEFMKKPNVSAAFLSDDWSIMFSLSRKSEVTIRKGLWKHNNSWCMNITYTDSMKKTLYLSKKTGQWKYYWWTERVCEYLNYEMELFLNFFSKEAVRSNKVESSALATKLNILESKIRYRQDLEYIQCKGKLDKLEVGATGMSTWKIAKFFLKSSKESCGSKSNKNHLIQWERTNEKLMKKKINPELFKFYKVLFEAKSNVSKALIQDYLNCIETLKLTKQQSQKCEGVFLEQKLLKALKEMPKKSPLETTE